LKINHIFWRSKDTQTGTIYIKGVNAAGQAQKVKIVLDGISGVSPQGTATVLTSSSPQDTNNPHRAGQGGSGHIESESQWQLRIQFCAIFRNGFGDRDQVI
jgi:hypothetical protein